MKARSVALLAMFAIASVAHGDAVAPVPDTTVRLAAPVVQGALTADAVRRAVLPHLGEVRHCYERGLAEGAEPRGRVVVHVRIGQNGRVVSATVASSTLHTHVVGECIVTSARRWSFPVGLAIVEADLPFDLATPGTHHAPPRHGLI